MIPARFRRVLGWVLLGLLGWGSLSAAVVADVSPAVKDTSVAGIALSACIAILTLAWKLFRESTGKGDGGDKDDGRWQGEVRHMLQQQEQMLREQTAAFRAINQELVLHSAHLTRIVAGWDALGAYMNEGRAAMHKIEQIHERGERP